MLFDMNRFFQELLSRFLHEHLTEYTVRDEYRLRELFSYDPAHNPRRRRSPTPRPDFMILDRGEVVAVLDAKSRDLWEHSLPRGMLYQLALYALSQEDCRRSVILYPTLEPTATEQRIRVHEPLYGAGRAEVVLRPVDLLRMERLLRSPDTHARVQERKAWARELALG
jgi:5-methylcytosine-specific restriction enzyme subunit McrC